MKALKLIIYPHPQPESDMPKHRLRNEFTKGAQRQMAEDKRFSDAELAAEHYRAKWTVAHLEARTVPIPDKWLARVATIERFARLPHALDTP